MKETCNEEILKRKLTKQDLEGFLSAFKYNVHGATDIGSIAPIVFEKDTTRLALSLTNKVRTNPPPMFVNQELAQLGSGSISDEGTARRLRKVLTDIEDTCFCGGKPRAFEIFR